MNLSSIDEGLQEHLLAVGFKGGDEVELANQLPNSLWAASYAELLLVLADDMGKDDLDLLLQHLDGVVAERLRRQRSEGIYRDSHVCLIVSPALLKEGTLARESDLSRFVSRKYWINAENAVEDLISRLAITWVDVNASASIQLLEPAADLLDARRRILDRKGAGAASDFLEAIIQ